LVLFDDLERFDGLPRVIGFAEDFRRLATIVENRGLKIL
jgi:hypothetical protein